MKKTPIQTKMTDSRHHIPNVKEQYIPIFLKLDAWNRQQLQLSTYQQIEGKWRQQPYLSGAGKPSEVQKQYFKKFFS